MDGMKGTITITEAVPEKVSQEIIEYLEQVSNRTASTGRRIEEQLQEICMEPIPPAIEDAEAKKNEVCLATREYPTYFNVLRQRIQRIESEIGRAHV